MSKNKTFSSEISQRYALAFYDLAREKNKTEEFAASISSFKRVFENLQFYVEIGIFLLSVFESKVFTFKFIPVSFNWIHA